MGLLKSYQVICEGTDLHLRREYDATGSYDAGKIERRDMRDHCPWAGERTLSAKAARASVQLQGWVRHAETIRIYRGSSETSVVRFDLCPNCAAKLIAAERGAYLRPEEEAV